ncbi:MAG TPA: nodulation protein NfeD [Chitinophagaceae bacterium]|nr:nodulation protein NfeD [Chitinophagaceae bacterium]
MSFIGHIQEKIRSLGFLFIFIIPLSSFAQTVYSLKLDGEINPVTQGYIHRGIKSAESNKAVCLIIHLNTPGGLLESTRSIVSDILESRVPVIVYVSPGGAHAGSAGVFITIAANIAAMAPGTNIGAAHPVELHGGYDSIMNEKVTNDAMAFIRSIAEKRNRDFQWAEQAVHNSVSITDSEALQLHVIDLIAKDTRDLLRQIDGKTVQLNSGPLTLDTRNARIVAIDMKPSEKFLYALSDPNIAYVLLLIGIFGVLFEFFNPGAIFPGVIGGICLIMAFYSMNTLPVNYAGLALIIFAIILFVLEIKIASHGILAIGGIIALFLGSMMLIRTDSSLDVIRISLSVIITSVIVTGLFFIFVIGMGLKAQLLKPVTGIEGMIGETGNARETMDPDGTVQVHGEIWNAQSVTGRIEKDAKIKVTAIKNLKLFVELINN